MTIIQPHKARAKLKEQSQKGFTLTAYYLIFLIIGYAGVALGPTLPYLAAQTNSSLSQISIIFSAKSTGYLLGALGVSRLYDTVSGHKLMAIVAGGFAVLVFFTPLIPNLWALSTLMVFIGITGASLDIGGNTLLIKAYKEKAGSYLNGMHLMFGIGAVLAPLAVAQVLQRQAEIKWVFWLISILPLVLMPVLISLPSPEIGINEKEERGDPRFQGAAIIFVLFFFSYVAVESSFGGWIYTYMVEMNLSNSVTAAYLNSAFWGALIIGRIISIPLASRVNQVKIMKWNLAGTILSMAVFVSGQENFSMVQVGTMGLGFSFASIFPSMLAIADKTLGISGKVMGWFFTGASLGGMTVPWLIGQFFESIGPQTFVWGIVACFGLSLVSFIVLDRKYVRI